jgi:hypothetical protein
MMGFRAMNEEAVDQADQADEEDNLAYEVSDDELEAASGAGLLGGPTMVSSGTIGMPYFCC